MKLLILFLVVLSSVFAEVENFHNLFTPAIYQQVVKNKQGNFMVSAFSLHTILSLLESGSRGATAEELRKVLHLPDNRTAIEASFKDVNNKLKQNEYTLETANKIYIKPNLTVKKEFRKSAADVYSSEVEEIDFNKTETVKTINSWVEKKTGNKIQNVVEENQINDKTQALLINVLYFNATWAISFPPTVTQKAKFYKKDKTVEVDTMFLEEEEFLYYECPHLKAQFLELPFKGEDASMTIVLPNQNNTLQTLENEIDKVLVRQNLTTELVTIQLPKFKIDSKFDFKKIIANLGVKKIFDANEADLSGIAGESLIVSKIFQKTFVDVNEFGVEAAAATYIPAVVPSMGSVTSPKLFVADHPFIFYIRVKGIIIFAGRVTSPNYQ